MQKRCFWATTPLSIAYHDQEWGVPVHDDTRFFEFLILEGAQAGLSWETFSKTRRTTAPLSTVRSAKGRQIRSAQDCALLKNAGIIRNRLKINSAVTMPGRFSTSRKISAVSITTSGGL